MSSTRSKNQLEIAKEYEGNRRQKWEQRKKTLGLKAAKTSWRNYHKFTGRIPSYKLFSRINWVQNFETPDYMPRKRANIEIFTYLTPWEIIFVVSGVWKSFYILSWNKEVIKRVLIAYLGNQKFQEVKYKISKQFLANEDIPSSLKGKILDVSSSSSEDFSEASGHNVNLSSTTSSGEEEMIKKRIKNYEPRVRKRDRINFKKITLSKVLTKLHGRKKKMVVDEIIDPEFTTTEEEDFIDKTIRSSRSQIKQKKIEKYSNIIDETPDFLRKLMTFIAKVRSCSNWYYMPRKNDEYGILLQSEILNVPLCFSWSKSDKFAMMTIASINQKYGINKKELDESGLKCIKVPNPQAIQLEMNLYYEFQVKEKLNEIFSKRETKKVDQKIKRQVEKECKQMSSINGKKAEFILRLQSRQSKIGEPMTRKQIEKKYIEHPLSQLYMEGKYMVGKSVWELKEIIDDDEKWEKELLKVNKRKAKSIVKAEFPDEVIVVHQKRKKKRNFNKSSKRRKQSE